MVKGFVLGFLAAMTLISAAVFVRDETGWGAEIPEALANDRYLGDWCQDWAASSGEPYSYVKTLGHRRISSDLWHVDVAATRWNNRPPFPWISEEKWKPKRWKNGDATELPNSEAVLEMRFARKDYVGGKRRWYLVAVVVTDKVR